jgi:hypothetical protein
MVVNITHQASLDSLLIPLQLQLKQPFEELQIARFLFLHLAYCCHQSTG